MGAKLYDFVVKDQKGQDVKLSQYEGKVLLIVNTATGCGFTPQYKALEELYRKYESKGFVILDFPCNQFANQAPGKDEEIHSFCTLKYNVSFPQFHKIDVNGKNAAPLYVYLKKAKRWFFTGRIKWNFTKFLVNKEGTVVARFAPSTKPEKLEKDIVRLLGE